MEWLTELAEFKEFLLFQSTFQMVGSKVYLEVLRENTSPKMMLEVVGIPRIFEGNSLELVDQEGCEVFVYKMAEKDLFQLDLIELMQTAQTLHKSLNSMLEKSGQGLGHIFHIVFDNPQVD
jgi:hypothetical protein